jgi:hypothetical protein
MSKLKPNSPDSGSAETALRLGNINSPIGEGNVLKSNLPYLQWPSLVPGHRVVVERGPLMGMQGVLLQIKQVHRLVVLINLLQRAVAFELDASWVRPIDNEPFTQLEAPREHAPSA